MSALVNPIIAAPLFEVDDGRIDVELPHGLSIRQMIATVLPNLAAPEARVRVVLVTAQGAEVIAPDYWTARPKPGVQVVIRVLPGKDSLRSILSIAVTVAATAMGQVWGPMVGQALGLGGKVGTALVTAGASIMGQLLINALIPPPRPDDQKQRQTYTISGWRNKLEPDGAIPVVLGRHRYAPPFAATSWTEIAGDLQYVRALFCFGYGPLELSDFRLGETVLTEFDEVQIETRNGLPGEAPVTLYPQQVLEESLGVELTRPLPRNDSGAVVEGPAKIVPVTRTSAADAATLSVILAWPAGLMRVNGKGKKRSHSVRVRIEQRQDTASEWSDVTILTIRARKTEAFYRQHSWQPPQRGRWQVRLTMLTDETDDMQVTQRTVWTALQSIRPEYPLAPSSPMSLVAVRIKATHQLNGALDDFSAIASRICPDWDAASQQWVMRATSNPASLYRYALQSPANPRPQSDAQIDLDLLAEWHGFCAARGLTYDRVLDDASLTLAEALTEIAGAGRATPRHDGLRWGVTIDRPGNPVIDHITPRNSWDFKASRSYVRQPDALRVKFNDADNDYTPAERLIRRPGHTGEITLTEALALPGATHGDQVWREAYRRFLEIDLRPDSYEVMQDGPIRVVTRGDRVAVSHDVLDRTQLAARVRTVWGRVIEIDEAVEIMAGVRYGIRYRVDLTRDGIGRSVLAEVSAEVGSTHLLSVDGTAPMPAPGDLILIGQAATVSAEMIVTGIETAEGDSCLIRLVDAADAIDAQTSAATPEPWSPRVGAPIDLTHLAPAVPVFEGITSGAAGTGTAGQIEVMVQPGSGAVPPVSITVWHRLAGAPDWASVTVDAAEGVAVMTGYTTGQSVELRADAVSITGAVSPSTSILTYTVGTGDAAIPAAIEASGIAVTALPGGARIDFATPADAAIAEVQLYRSTSATLDRAADATGDPIPVSAARRFTAVLGDGTRSNLLANGDFTTATGWMLGAGWSVTGGTANHTAGAAGDLAQAVTLTPGGWLRLGWGLSAVSGGSITPLITGAAEVSVTGQTTPGSYVARLKVPAGATAIAWRAASASVAQIDNVVAYPETPACLPQGVNYIWIEPLNADGQTGPVSGPIPVTII